MKRFFIEDAKCGVTDGGMACGPVPGDVVAAVKYRTEKETKWLYMIEIGSDTIPCFFLSDKDVFEKLIENEDGDEFNDYMKKCALSEFNGLELSADCSHVETT